MTGFATARPTSTDDVQVVRRRLRQILLDVDARGPSVLATGASALVLLAGVGSIVTNGLDWSRMFVVGGFELAFLLLILQVHHDERRVDVAFLALLGFGLVVASVLGALPEYFGLPAINAVFHRSVPTAMLFLPLGTLSLSATLYHLLGQTPGAEDLAHYPIILAPALMALAAYAYLLFGLLEKGLPTFDLQLVFRPYLNHQETLQLVDGAGNATQSIKTIVQSGFSNHLLGTLILVGLTTIISLPLGVGTGVYLSEYANGRMAGLVRSSTTALRAISPFTIGLTALSMVTATRGTPLGQYFSGFHYAQAAGKTIYVLDNGSFLPAALAISMLVVPVIARATEEGCRSLPAGLREGSVALGASEGYTLRRIILPWAVPNVITATLLGCAEAAGCLAPVLFIAGTGENGVGLFSQATSLSWAIFGAVYSNSKPFRDQMRPHQFDEGLLLLALALTLSVVATVINRRFAGRYRRR